MKIKSTFVECLYAFKYAGEEVDAFESIFDKWSDASFLFEFFEENEADLEISIEEAILKVKREAKSLRDRLLSFAGPEPNRLGRLFRNLNNSEYTYRELSQQKARNRWLRLYAIRIDANTFVITGGAIKLDKQHLMQEKEHTRIELKKINKCRNYLMDEGIFDVDSFQEIVF